MGESTTASTGNAARSGSIFGRVGKRKIEARWKNGLKAGGGGGGGGGKRLGWVFIKYVEEVLSRRSSGLTLKGQK